VSETVRSLWQLLLLTRDVGSRVQLTCEECFTLLEYDAELLADGIVPDEIRPAVSRLLSLCPQCRAKFDGWLEKLDRI